LLEWQKDISKQIKPFNFVLIGQAAESSAHGEPIHPITRFNKRPEEAPFQPFVDYRTGKRYSGGSHMYWKTLSAIVQEYLNHPETKFRNGQETGKMKRRHLHLTDRNIRFIGKEADEIEEAQILGVSEDSYVEYR
jgi:hypothetical protein